jgi:hypothetical protein
MTPARGLQDGRNFRVRQGKLSNINLGWELHSQLNFGNPIMMIETFTLRSGLQRQIIATTKDIFNYDAEADTATYLNPIWSAGRVNVAAGNPAVVTSVPQGPLPLLMSGPPTAFVFAGIQPGDQISFGDADEHDLTATWYTIASIQNQGQLTLTTAVAGAPLTNQLYTIRRRFTGTTENIWDSAVFLGPDDGQGGVGDDLFFLTNGVDFVLTWDGLASSVISHPELGFTCKNLFTFKNMMLYSNLVMSGEALPVDLINSDFSFPLKAGFTGTGVSEQFRVHDGADPIIGMEDMGDNLVFYSERHVTMCQFVGDPFIFIFREAGEGVGPISGRLIADFGDYHEFIGNDSQYLFDGVTLARVNQQVWREVLRIRDGTRNHLGFCHFDEENGDLIWAIPLTSDVGQGVATNPPEEAFVEHYLEEVGQNTPTAFSRRAMPFSASGLGVTAGNLTWDEMVGTWDQQVILWSASQLFAGGQLNLMGSVNGFLYKINTVQTGAGALLPSFVRFGRRASVDGRQRGLLTRLYPFTEQLTQNITITVRMMDHASGPATTVDNQTFSTALLEGVHFTTHYRRGRYFEVDISSTGVPWSLSGYDLDMKSGGRR